MRKIFSAAIMSGLMTVGLNKSAFAVHGARESDGQFFDAPAFNEASSSSPVPPAVIHRSPAAEADEAPPMTPGWEDRDALPIRPPSTLQSDVHFLGSDSEDEPEAPVRRPVQRHSSQNARASGALQQPVVSRVASRRHIQRRFSQGVLVPAALQQLIRQISESIAICVLGGLAEEAHGRNVLAYRGARERLTLRRLQLEEQVRNLRQSLRGMPIRRLPRSTSEG